VSEFSTAATVHTYIRKLNCTLIQIFIYVIIDNYNNELNYFHWNIVMVRKGVFRKYATQKKMTAMGKFVGV
jgi:hypothetical protein